MVCPSWGILPLIQNMIYPNMSQTNLSLKNLWILSCFLQFSFVYIYYIKHLYILQTYNYLTIITFKATGYYNVFFICCSQSLNTFSDNNSNKIKFTKQNIYPNVHFYIINLHINNTLHMKLRNDKDRNRQSQREKLRIIAKFLFLQNKYSAFW